MSYPPKHPKNGNVDHGDFTPGCDRWPGDTAHIGQDKIEVDENGLWVYISGPMARKQSKVA